MEDANTCGGEEGNQISKRERRSLLSNTQKTKEEDEPFWKEKNETKEEEACGEVAGCTGEEGKRGRKHFLKRKKKKMFFF